MAKAKTIEIQAATIDAERRTFWSENLTEKNCDPVLNWKRETWAPVSDVPVSRETHEHQRVYSKIKDETIEIHDAAGNLVTVKASGLFEGTSKFYDKWSAEDGEVSG